MSSLRFPAVLVLAVALSGCSGVGEADEDGAREAALAFYGQLDQPESACGMLAPGTLAELESSSGPCPEALPEEDLPSAASVRRIEVYNKQAMVELDQDVAFLAHFRDGWRVTAAGCKVSRPDRPLDCSVKGP